jgi:hypothetical protein
MLAPYKKKAQVSLLLAILIKFVWIFLKKAGLESYFFEQLILGSSGNLTQHLRDIIAARGRYEKERTEELSSFISS